MGWRSPQGPMSRSSRIILFALTGFVALLVVVATGLFLLVRANVDKARLEATASEALAMQVVIGGRVRLDLFPSLLVTLEDVHVRNGAVEVASAKAVELGIDPFSLLRSNVLIETFAVKGPWIAIERYLNGRYNFESPQAAEAPLPALYWPRVSFSDGTLLYADKQSGAGFEAEHCGVDVSGLRLGGGQRANLLRHLSFTAGLACGQVRTEGLTAVDLKLSAEAKDGVFDLKPIAIRVFGSQGPGSIRADFSGSEPIYHFRWSLPQFPIEEFFKAVSPKTLASGRMDFSVNLSMQGRTLKMMRQAAQGQISLRGKDLTLAGTDLDAAFSRFESSQNFNLVDVGAFFFAGPLALVVTKGYNFASNFQGTQGSSEIRTLVSDWTVERGVAQAQDVAMATRENRIALHGGLDFVDDRFDDVTMALIDTNGCAKVRQKIRGSFQHPVVENPSVLTSAAGPALRLLKKGSDLLRGRKCPVFYAGSVPAPK
jgi:uncharacterized protein involved in outer membrane biogenesis